MKSYSGQAAGLQNLPRYGGQVNDADVGKKKNKLFFMSRGKWLMKIRNRRRGRHAPVGDARHNIDERRGAASGGGGELFPVFNEMFYPSGSIRREAEGG